MSGPEHSHQDESGAGAAPAAAAPEPTVITVSSLNRQVALLLGRQFPLLWVRGEVSNFTRAASGHCYFVLKDDRAQARAVLFRARAAAVPFALRNGLLVDVQASVTLYEARGEFQLGVERMRAAGAGDLHQQFLLLRERLQREGLFDEASKRPLPAMPRRLAVVTSLQAAALRDVLITLRARAPHLPVIVYPTPVQGTDAATQIVAALLVASQRAECDCLLLVRGGGAMEDLWSFNDERVARAIRASSIPVVVGVGHESDFTIADFAADVRAATPTAAAVLASPSRADLEARAWQARDGLRRAMQRGLDVGAQRVDTAARLLKTPREQLRTWHARLAGDLQRLGLAHRRRIESAVMRLLSLEARVAGPDVVARRQDLERLVKALTGAGARTRSRARERVDALAAQLALVDPSRVLRRGYAVVRNENRQVISSVAQVDPHDRWEVTFADGQVDAVVTDTPRPVAGAPDDSAKAPPRARRP